MLSGLKLTPFADNAQFFGLTGGRAHYETLFDTVQDIMKRLPPGELPGLKGELAEKRGE